MEVIHECCAGLDVHKETVVGCLRVRERGRVRREVRRWATTTAELLKLGDWLRQAGCTHVAMEATGVYWKPVWHMLEGEFELLLANPAHIRNVPGRKSDINDATWIADLLAHGLIRASLVPPGPIQELRDLTRTRKQLMREITQHKQRIQKVLEDANVKLASVVSDVFGESGRRMLKALSAAQQPSPSTALPPPRRKPTANNHAPHFDIRTPLHRLTGGADLSQIDAIGPQAALQLVAEIGTDMSR
jgi:transposase